MGAVTDRIVLELHTVEDSLTGRATTSSGETREFTGWLGLLGALQALLPGGDEPSEREGAR